MKHLKELDMQSTQVTDLHPLQYLQRLERISVTYAHIVDVSPLANLTKLVYLNLRHNKIINWSSIKHHKNFPKLINEDTKYPDYELSRQSQPSVDEVQFYNKILKVHSSHKQIRIIWRDNIPKFRASLKLMKNYVSIMLNNQIMKMNIQLEMFVQLIQNNTIYSANYLD
ncbi:Conserved_hypothetical protein [Hexamita inflata]|uniref:Uncharacterized protein n=1 Tax=Hexamita inflata TaxID=28002 RepID=A0AA86NM13_9EUKA|nr:Conserved hypothetical protein [Hexamita inflata]CAI9921471.1 Conserved hypothetical protein [Hexamita inflata]